MVGLCAQLAVVARASLDTTQGVNFHAVVVPDTVYVGQQATYEVGVFIDDQLRLRLRRNPEFVPPDPQGMLAYEIANSPREPVTRRVGHHAYEVHVFERAFFPLARGRYEVPGAQLAYSLPLSLSFFSREETHALTAESLVIVARAPPAAGRPADYDGAVGEINVSATVDSAAARVGDPMRVTLTVTGRGNVKLFPRPILFVPWASTVPSQERVLLDTSSDQVRGSKDFEWLVTPRDSGRLALPSVRYPYFNPYTEHYEIAVTQPESIRVAPGSLVRADSAAADRPPPLAIRSLFRGTPPEPFYQGPGFLALAVAGPVPALLIAAWRRPRRRRGRALSPSAALRDAARAEDGATAAIVRRLFVRALAERFSIGPTTLTDRGALTHVLRREGVTADAAAETEAVLGMLDRAAYGADGPATKGLRARAYAAYAAAAHQARARRAAPAGTGGRAGRSGPAATLIIAALLLGGTASAEVLARAADAVAAREFAAGVASYRLADYRRAAAHFAAGADAAPRAPDAWANAGTAAWAIGDSAGAVIGWQQAGRLEPNAPDVRDRLALVRAGQDGPIARLPRVPVPWAADAALACWLAACAVAGARAARRQTVRSVAGAVSGLAAVFAAWIGVRADEAAAARHLAVVGPDASLYAVPALDAERVSRLDAGDVAFAMWTQGVWTHVRLDGDREGWIESARLTSLARR